jgi:hypothetical protein
VPVTLVRRELADRRRALGPTNVGGHPLPIWVAIETEVGIRVAVAVRVLVGFAPMAVDHPLKAERTSTAMRAAQEAQRETAILQGLRRWRDPDLNRGHRDFQSWAQVIKTGLFAGKTCACAVLVLCRFLPDFAAHSGAKRQKKALLCLFDLGV